MNFRQKVELLQSGAVEIIPQDDFERRIKESLRKKVPLKIKYGVDPTTADLHLGHAVPLRKLRQFQDLGHEVILLIGDFTAQIGDPSGEKDTRPPLSAAEVKVNAKVYTEQAFKILDRKKTKIVRNGDWFGKMNFYDVIRLSSQMTVARILERDDFKERMDKGKPLHLHEILYPLIQAYDSVVLKADVEVGGTDQIFNMLAGRELQLKFNQRPQVVMTLPLLVGIDGTEKMSKTKQNCVGIKEPPKEIFGKIMSIADELIIDYFKLTTNVSAGEIEQMRLDLRKKRANPANLKRRLAREIITIYYNEKKAEQAEKEFDLIFKARELPSKIEEVVIPKKLVTSGEIWIVKILTGIGFAKSSSEARRLIKQKGVRLDGKLIEDEEKNLDLKKVDGAVIQVGRRKFARLKFL